MKTTRRMGAWLFGIVILAVGASGPNFSFETRTESARDALSEARFFDPPLSARPSVLWTWLNGYVDNDRLTRELEEMKSKGLADGVQAAVRHRPLRRAESSHVSHLRP